MSLRIFDIVIGKQSQRQYIPMKPTPQPEPQPTMPTITMTQIRSYLKSLSTVAPVGIAVTGAVGNETLNIYNVIIQYTDDNLKNVMLSYIRLPDQHDIVAVNIKNVKFQKNSEDPSYKIPGLFTVLNGDLDNENGDATWKKLTEVVLDYEDVNENIQLTNTFQYNSKIETIHIYGKIGSDFVNNDTAFCECVNLKRVYFSKDTINQQPVEESEELTPNKLYYGQNKLYYTTLSNSIDVISISILGLSDQAQVVYSQSDDNDIITIDHNELSP